MLKTTVPSKNPQQRDTKQNKPFANPEDAELNEEARQKKMALALLVERVQDPSEAIAKQALEAMSAELKAGTSSMISVPLPLKFLRAHFDTLENFFKSLPDNSDLKKPLADVLSVLATTLVFTEPPRRRALWYSFIGTCNGLVSWGPEYLRNITREIIAEHEERQQAFLADSVSRSGTTFNLSDLIDKVMEIVPYYIQHHNEIEAIDLLVEVQQLRTIIEFTDECNYKRITRYLSSLANYTVTEDDFCTVLTVVYDIFKKMNEPCECVRVALKLGNSSLILQTLNDLPYRSLQRYQIGYILGQHRYTFPTNNGDEDTVIVEDDINVGLSNEWLTEIYSLLAKELDVLEPKLPEDVYKLHLEDRRRNIVSLDSAKQNLSSTLVNAFVNCGFGRDNLITIDNGSWVYKNKDHGMTSASASLGAISLWNIEAGFTQIDKFHWSPNPLISSGALMAFGLVCSGIRNECDPAFAILIEQLENGASKSEQTIGALLGLAFSHIGVPREVFLDFLVPEVIDANISVDISACTALTLGLSYLGTANEAVAGALLQTLMERQYFSGNLDTPLAYLFAVGLGLLYLKQKNACEATLSALDAVSDHPMGRFAKECILGCAFAGTGDVTKIQYFLRICGSTETRNRDEKSEVVDVSKDNDSAKATAGTDDGDLSISSMGQFAPNASVGNVNDKARITQTGGRTSGTGTAQAASVTSTDSNSLYGMEQSATLISVALIALGEEIGSTMILRMVDHLLQYGRVQVRRGVPLCLGLLYASAPKPIVIEILSKLTHDSESEVALNSIFALGLVGAGTNNSRIAEFLRQLASYYSKSASALFLVRIAQGLLYMGKGLLTISPLHSDGFLIRPASLASLIVVVYTALFMKTTLLSRYHYLLYFLIAGATPRMLITLDKDLKLLPIPVRVGQKLNLAGVAGTPRTITGFQTHVTPVLLSDGERAELATSDYKTVGLLPLEGVVILEQVTCNKDEVTSH